jgi:hypothetical protein
VVLALALLGAALVLTGVALIYVPAALVLGGLACLVVARAALPPSERSPSS